MQKLRLLSSNTLKIIACASMLLDHIGLMLFPSLIIFRILGRIAFPIFAFMIAQGTRYTKNKLKYLMCVLIFACICQVGLSAFSSSDYLCVLVTFSISIVVIYAFDLFKRLLFSQNATTPQKIVSALVALFAIAVAFFLNYASRVEYGFFGIMLPVLVSLPYMPEGAPEKIKRLDTHLCSLILCAIGMCLMLLDSPMGKIQLFSFLALPLLLLYSGKRGKWRLKYFFYIFYPTHIALIALVAILVR